MIRVRVLGYYPLSYHYSPYFSRTMKLRIQNISFSNGLIITTTTDGSVYYRKLSAVPRLKSAGSSDLLNYGIGKFGDDVRWKSLDEDIHISSLINDSCDDDCIDEPQKDFYTADEATRFMERRIRKMFK